MSGCIRLTNLRYKALSREKEDLMKFMTGLVFSLIVIILNLASFCLMFLIENSPWYTNIVYMLAMVMSTFFGVYNLYIHVIEDFKMYPKHW